MAYRGRTVDECYRAWQKDALPHITRLSQYLGIPLMGPHHGWRPDNPPKNSWWRRGQRDRIHFGNTKVIKIERKSGSPVPSGEMKKELVLVGSWDNEHNLIEEVIVKWERGTSREFLEAKSELYGWSITTSVSGSVGSNEANKVEFGFEVSAHGEYAKETATTDSVSDVVSLETKYSVPDGKVLEVVQEIESGEIEVPYTDKLVFDIDFFVVDWKRLKNSRLYSHSGYGKWGRTKSRKLWHCTSANDLDLMLRGKNARYPNQSISIYNTSGRWLKNSINWLMNEENRTMIVESKAIYKQGYWGRISSNLK